jgi:hypothetical protein
VVDGEEGFSLKVGEGSVDDEAPGTVEDADEAASH